MSDLQTMRDQVDQLRAEAIDEGKMSMAQAYCHVIGIIDPILGRLAPAVTCERRYSDAEIQERLDTAGSHPHSEARDLQMLRQVWGERAKPWTAK